MAVHTKANREWSVAGGLRQHGVEVLMLHQRVQVRHARTVAIKRRPLFSRYVICALDGHLGLLDVIPGVASGVVHAAGVMLRIPEAVITELRGRGDVNGQVGGPPLEPPRLPRLEPGSEVAILTGSLAGFLGIVATASDSPKVRLWLKLFKRGKTLTTVDRSNLKLLRAPKKTGA